MIVAFSVAPASADPDEGMSAAVAEAVRVVRESGLPNETNSMFTLVEGEWDEVMALVGKCHREALKGAPRALTTITIDDRPGKPDRITGKVRSVEAKLGRALKT